MSRFQPSGQNRNRNKPKISIGGMRNGSIQYYHRRSLVTTVGTFTLFTISELCKNLNPFITVWNSRFLREIFSLYYNS
jgi:hypothetical protein